MIYLQLFLSFLQIGLFSFGGGYAAMPLIQDQVVTRYGWLSMAEFTDLITISQMTPGPIAVNSATFVASALPESPGRWWLPSAVFCPPVSWSLPLPGSTSSTAICRCSRECSVRCARRWSP